MEGLSDVLEEGIGGLGDLVEAAKRQKRYTVMNDIGRHTMFPDHIISSESGDVGVDVEEMNSIMRDWESYDDIKRDTQSVIARGEPADFVIINLDLIIEERTDVSGIEVLQVIRNGKIIYDMGL